MIVRRVASSLLIAWALGFVWFSVTLPQPAGDEPSQGVVVLTGAAGRIDRGIEVLNRGWARRLFVSGVDNEVKPHEFALEYHVLSRRMACCVTLGYEAVDTRSNASETAGWLVRQHVTSVRLVTSDWHMRRAAMELRRAAPAGTRIIEDAVPSQPTLRILFVEYHKLLARYVSGLAGGLIRWR